MEPKAEMANTKTVEPAQVAVSSTAVLDARVGVDRCHKRGQVCRGAYITNAYGTHYLTHRGTWTHGIAGDENWWDDNMAAENALVKFKTRASNAAHKPSGDNQ